MVEEYLAARREMVESYLEAYLKARARELPQTLHQAIAYALEGGKRLRPILVLAAAEALGGDAEEVLPTAGAFELFHTYSLIHDDLPALDDADLRRDQLTVHRVFGEAAALLAGDALIPLGFELIAKEQARISPEDRVLRVIGLVSEALGPAGMVGGQLLELEERFADPEALEEIYSKKTAALLGAATAAGAVLTGGGEGEVTALHRFGLCLGLAYQLIDDLLDLGEDEGPTYVHLVGEREGREEAERLTGEALQALASLGNGAANLRALARWLLSRRS
ncbi:MAG: polyprenyl synthetase family protein [Candidatus Acetothermia bacterium]|jgi:geranylgeranyl diphosphate synthase type II|nr:polyprenyl synthetase family protein [Candidatus Acetothermia bacterium]MDH7505732.1 polyprenyl synthetase family protein [Candidatus Acetothermia bacterium]